MRENADPARPREPPAVDLLTGTASETRQRSLQLIDPTNAAEPELSYRSSKPVDMEKPAQPLKFALIRQSPTEQIVTQR